MLNAARLRRFVPPQWRQLARGTADPWLLVGIGAAIAGGAWLVSPVGAGGKLRDMRERLEPSAPANATGRAMGLTRVPRGAGGDPYPRSVDPLDVLGRGAGVPSHMQPTLRSRQLPAPLIAPRPNHLPTRAQELRNLALLPPILPPAPRGDPSHTAADILNAQLGKGANGG